MFNPFISHIIFHSERRIIKCQSPFIIKVNESYIFASVSPQVHVRSRPTNSHRLDTSGDETTRIREITLGDIYLHITRKFRCFCRIVSSDSLWCPRKDLGISILWVSCEMFVGILSMFSTWRICSREQRKKQFDWLATNTDDIATQSHSLFLLVRAKIFAKWKSASFIVGVH